MGGNSCRMPVPQERVEGDKSMGLMLLIRSTGYSITPRLSGCLPPITPKDIDSIGPLRGMLGDP